MSDEQDRRKGGGFGEEFGTDNSDDNICPQCDSTGTDEDGHLCQSCQGKGYVNP